RGHVRRVDRGHELEDLRPGHALGLPPQPLHHRVQAVGVRAARIPFGPGAHVVLNVVADEHAVHGLRGPRRPPSDDADRASEPAPFACVDADQEHAGARLLAGARAVPGGGAEQERQGERGDETGTGRLGHGGSWGCIPGVRLSPYTVQAAWSSPVWGSPSGKTMVSTRRRPAPSNDLIPKPAVEGPPNVRRAHASYSRLGSPHPGRDSRQRLGRPIYIWI